MSIHRKEVKMNKSTAPIWSKKAQKKLIDLGMSKKQLAAELKVNYRQLCNVLTGYVNTEPMKQRICEYLKIGG